jgi:hypothetical protein
VVAQIQLVTLWVKKEDIQGICVRAGHYSTTTKAQVDLIFLLFRDWPFFIHNLSICVVDQLFRSIEHEPVNHVQINKGSHPQ